MIQNTYQVRGRTTTQLLLAFGLENSEVVYLGGFGEMVPEAVPAQAMLPMEAIRAGDITLEDCTVEEEETGCVK